MAQESEAIFTTIDKCRICNSGNLTEYFNFGEMPLVDSFVKPGEREEPKIPMAVMFCKECSNSQLNVVVSPKHLFSNYIYHSSVSQTYKNHCAEMAKFIASLLNRKNLKCLDLASNDGCLLDQFSKQGYDTIGVEPAQNLSEIANNNGILTINSFWNKDAAKKVIEKKGKVDAITATNVLAHVPDTHSFVEAVNEVLDDNGIFVAEVPYMKNLIQDNEFDTILHEHVSYFLLKPLIRLFEAHNLKVYDVLEFGIHGGTIRVIAIKKSNTKLIPKKDKIDAFLEKENRLGLNTLEPYNLLEKNAKEIKENLLNEIKKIKLEGKKIAGYGASGKGNTFVNYCGLNKEDISYIIDDTKDKQGKLYPGTKIPIVPYEHLKKETPDYILILAWNFADEIIRKVRERGDFKGKYIIAIPRIKILK